MGKKMMSMVMHLLAAAARAAAAGTHVTRPRGCFIQSSRFLRRSVSAPTRSSTRSKSPVASVASAAASGSHLTSFGRSLKSSSDEAASRASSSHSRSCALPTAFHWHQHHGSLSIVSRSACALSPPLRHSDPSQSVTTPSPQSPPSSKSL
jgi:hypothetical protein